MIFKGFKFGMLLQLAVGPICLLIFQTAISSGFFIAGIGVLGVTIVDILYILLAILGIGTLLNKSSYAKSIIKYFGALILIIFGISNITGAFGQSLIPSLNFIHSQNVENILLKTMLLTLSNPLTILFWAGVFSTKIIDENMKDNDLYLFGFGAVLSTILFLSFIATLGSMANNFLSTSLINFLNVVVGFVLIGFGVNTLNKK
ncbi:LysE family transporter [Romboutsia sp.]|uniref:LysE family transporter n=1 Tax=Romboutsia sp. TaxID=1965302 RepID=UPI003F2D44DC